MWACQWCKGIFLMSYPNLVHCESKRGIGLLANDHITQARKDQEHYTGSGLALFSRSWDTGTNRNNESTKVQNARHLNAFTKSHNVCELKISESIYCANSHAVTWSIVPCMLAMRSLSLIMVACSFVFALQGCDQMCLSTRDLSAGVGFIYKTCHGSSR